MYEPKSPMQATKERLAADRARMDARLTKAQDPSNTHAGRCRAAASELVEQVRRGDMALAGEARRTLDTLCWSQSGYPEHVQEILRAGGLS